MTGKRVLLTLFIALLLVGLFGSAAAFGAYSTHDTDDDSGLVRLAYPALTNTKLDSCTLCHRGGVQGGKDVGSCQWCHTTFGYDASGDILQTLNAYGMDYMTNGADLAAFVAIAARDSDGDGYSNADEIAALRFPGDPNDDPTKVAAPARVYTLDEIMAMPAHTQFMLMNTHKSSSGDFYATYTGVVLKDLLADAGVLGAAESIKVIAADGFSVYHPLNPTPTPMPGVYPVRADYPDSTFFYNIEADKKFTSYGWCDYSAPSVVGRVNGDPITGLEMLLAYKYEGKLLVPGSLGTGNKLTSDSEGPFRVVPPQLKPGPPDQSSRATKQDVIWPFDEFEATTDHNAGFSSKCATIIKVEPLPEGTTDINLLEAGWNYIDQGKIVIYGAIDPVPTAMERAAALVGYAYALDSSVLRARNMGGALANKLEAVNNMLAEGDIAEAIYKIESDLMPKVDGFAMSGTADKTDWVLESNAQRHVYWGLQELLTLLGAAG